MLMVHLIDLARARGLDNTSTTEIPVGTEWNEWQDQWTGNERSSTTWIKNRVKVEH